MSDNAKMISLTAMCETATEVDTAQRQVQNAADVLRAQGITHSVGFMEVEEGPEPSVWRDAETGTVIRRVPQDSEGYYGSTVALGLCFEGVHHEQHQVPVMKSFTAISEEWEVLY
jgi:hypothetical protein